MKSLGTMAKVSGALGYAAYNSIKSTNAQTRQLNQVANTKNIAAPQKVDTERWKTDGK